MAKEHGTQERGDWTTLVSFTAKKLRRAKILAEHLGDSPLGAVLFPAFEGGRRSPAEDIQRPVQ